MVGANNRCIIPWKLLPSHLQTPEFNHYGTKNLATSPTYHAAKRQRTIRTLFFGDEEHMKLHNVLKMLKSIDICAFLLMVNALPERPIKTYLYMEHNRVFNLDKEREQVMNFLFEARKAGKSNVTILPIVGSEGAGKTSLALQCFYDSKVQNHFSLKIYIGSTLISYANIRGFPIILEEILKQCNNTYTTNYDENTLLVMLKKNLSSERFLLVLDHVWDVDCTVWNALWDCLRCGKLGSKVIFISSIDDYRSYKKIVNPDAVMPVMLDGFSEDEFMLFFKEHAFGGADPEDYPELEKMGKEMAKKMNGSLWGAMIFGELLRDNLNAPFWSNFLQGDFLSPLARSKDIWPVMEAMCLLLPKNLQVSRLEMWTEPVEHCRSHEVKTFRELMVLGLNHCTPLNKDEKNCGVQILVSNCISK